ncbi:MAG TPA: hypothetical protein VHF27_07795 [Acidimicrobiales bacterium]|nr:hypothetical protein [Acidimicrobiales bacterium]
MSLFGSLDGLPPLAGGREFTVVADDPVVVEKLREEGLPSVLWSPDLVVPDGARILLALCHQLVSRAVRKQFSEAAVLVLPIYSFDDDYASILYTLRMVFETDYLDACQNNRDWLDMLANKPDGTLHFTGGNSDLRARLHDNIRANTSLDLEIGKGEWVSVADYCEVSVTAPSQSDWLGAFTIDGYAEAVGVLVAEDSRVTPLGKERILAAKQLRSELVENGPVRLVVKEGVLQEAIVAGRDRSKEISEVVNPEYGLHTLELGLGSNPSIAPLVDWQFNSQLNEGVGKVHLGFGEGITGAHMDFIIDQVSVS